MSFFLDIAKLPIHHWLTHSLHDTIHSPKGMWPFPLEMRNTISPQDHIPKSSCLANGKSLQKIKAYSLVQISSVQLFATPWMAAHQDSLSITKSRSLLKLMSIESVMPFNHLILCCLLLLLSSIFTSIRIFSSESVLHFRWPKFWSFSFSISPSNEYSGLISLRIDCFDLFAVQGTLKSLL